MKQNHKSLNFLHASLFLIIFSLIVFSLTIFLAALNKQREKDTYLAYANETQEYIQKNKANLMVLFNDIFPKSSCVGTNRYEHVCAYPNQETIAKLLPSTLKDWSSTAFLKKDQGKILLMRLSGDTRELYLNPKKTYVLDNFFSGGEEQIPWDDYTYELSNKEVVIAVKDDSGKITGAIIRSVIEDKSF